MNEMSAVMYGCQPTNWKPLKKKILKISKKNMDMKIILKSKYKVFEELIEYNGEQYRRTEYADKTYDWTSTSYDEFVDKKKLESEYLKIQHFPNKNIINL